MQITYKNNPDFRSMVAKLPEDVKIVVTAFIEGDYIIDSKLEVTKANTQLVYMETYDILHNSSSSLVSEDILANDLNTLLLFSTLLGLAIVELYKAQSITLQ